MAIIDVSYLQAWTNVDIAAAREEAAEACIDAASDWIAAETGRQIEQASLTRIFDGDTAPCGAGRELLFLNPGHRPVAHSGEDLVTVSEDGTSLTIGTGYDSTGQKVLVANANVDAACYLIRLGGWSSGVQNITVAYKAGWTSAAMPARVKQLCAEVALHFFRAPTWAGKASESKAGSAVTVRDSLSPLAKQTLAELTVL